MTDAPIFRFRGLEPPTEASRASILVPQSEGTVAELYLYDPIDSWGGSWGVSAKEFAVALALLPEDTTEIRLHINSPGGEVWDAMAIVNQLRRHDARVVAVVDGIAASAASVIAATADECVMGLGAQLMIHDAWNIAIGDEAAMLAEAARLNKDSNSIAAIYAAKAGGKAEDWRALMRETTWYTAQEAVNAGLADRTTDDVPTDAKAVLATQNARAFLSLQQHAAAAALPAAATAAHMPPSSSEPVETNPQKGVTMGDILKSGLHNRLGIQTPIDTMTDEQLLAAVDEVLAEQAEQAPTAQAPEGTVLIDTEQLEALRADAAAGRQARDEQVRAHRAQIVDAAVADGRIAPARREHWLDALNADEEGAMATLESLAKGLIPMESIGSAGAPEADEDALARKAGWNTEEN